MNKPIKKGYLTQQQADFIPLVIGVVSGIISIIGNVSHLFGKSTSPWHEASSEQEAAIVKN